MENFDQFYGSENEREKQNLKGFCVVNWSFFFCLSTAAAAAGDVFRR